MVIAFACLVPLIAAFIIFGLRVLYLERTHSGNMTGEEMTSAATLALGVGTVVFVIWFVAMFFLFAASFEM
jgi:hypothetical protein